MSNIGAIAARVSLGALAVVLVFGACSTSKSGGSGGAGGHLAEEGEPC